MQSFMERHRFRSADFILYAVVIITVIVAMLLSTPSVDVASKNSPASEFSAERVYEHLKQFAQEPRHPGTLYHEQAKTYLVNTIKEMGLPVTVESAAVKHADNKELPIQNIVAKMEGTDPSGQIILMAHYDSVKDGPGVNDDAVNVGVILETIRLLKQDKPLKNDITFLLTDGEESGLLGATEYVKKHAADPILFVLNLEARGYKGPIVLFQIIGPNGRAIQLFEQHIKNPYAFSFLADLYRILPHDTDLSAFKSINGVVGMNLAYMEGASVYHTANDDLDHVHLPTVQNSGMHASTIIKALGSYDLVKLFTEEDRAYFNVFGNVLIHYPVSWNYILTAFAFSIASLTYALGLNKKIIRLGRGIRWALFVICSTILLYVFGTFYFIGYMIFVLNGWSAAFFIYLAVISVVSLLIGWILKKIKLLPRMKKLVNGLSVIDAIVGAILLMALLTLLSTFAFPGSHYLFVIPLMMSSISLMSYCKFQRWLPVSVVISLLAAVPLTLLLFPAFRLLAIGFGLAGIHYVLIALLLYVPLALPAFLNQKTAA